MMGSPGVPGALLSGWDPLVFPRVRATGGWLDGREDSGTPSSQVSPWPKGGCPQPTLCWSSYPPASRTGSFMLEQPKFINND